MIILSNMQHVQHECCMSCCISTFIPPGIDKMLKLGAYGVLNDRDDSDAQKFSEEDIDVILAKRARTVQAKIRGEGDEVSDM